MKTILQGAVFLHGFAGDRAVAQTGEMALTASDILDSIPGALSHLNEFQTRFPFSG